MCDSSQHDSLEYCMTYYIDYSVSLGNTTNMLSKPRGPLHAPSTSHFELSPVHSFTSSNQLQAFLLIFPLDCTLQDGVPFALSRVTTCPNNLNFLLLTISRDVSYFPMCSPTLLCMSTLNGRHSVRGIMHDV